MADLSTNAVVNLSINGRQAKQYMEQLGKQADTLREKIDKAANAGDSKKVQQLNKELRRVESQLRTVRTAATSTTDVMQRLDKATPKELRKALTTLRSQLNNLQRGTAAWDAHTAKIRQVREQLDQVSAEIKAANPDGGKFGSMFDSIKMKALAAVGAITGVTAAIKQAVDAYASMQQEEANVRKYTGMSEEDVKRLNEEFKKMDTRLSREQLNMLAQEAGRLGKTSVEDVLGFVRASAKVNVALDDLGDGATLTLSKLTGIFGDEKRLGTEKALLSVGSVINELSQNCSASAPYLADFASRVGGVGAQAGMTVQQIMAFGAVLDSNNQNVEASSTALSQVMVRIYQEPAKYAKVAGMDVANFTKLVKTDMNGALLAFLESLQKAGSMDVLAPMFKDMGENGARSISTLSTLVSHIDEVKAQQEAANQAFREATSIDKEFDVQNNTVQASLEKSRARLHELVVELGERLMPVARVAMDATGFAVDLIRRIINFISTYRRELLIAGLAIGAYSAAVALYNARVAVSTRLTAAWTAVTKAGRLVLGPFRMLLVMLTNGIQYLTNGFKVNLAMQKRWVAAMNAMKLTSAIGAILAVTTALMLLIKRNADHQNALRKQREEHNKYVKSLRDIDTAAGEYAAGELTRVKQLYTAATDESKARNLRLDAAKKLISLYPDQFKNMNAEAVMLGRAKSAYDKLTESIILNAKAKAAAEKVMENEKKILDLSLELDQAREEYTKADQERRAIRVRNSNRNQRTADIGSSASGAAAMAGQGMGNFSGLSSDLQLESEESQNERLATSGATIRRNKARLNDLNKANKWLTDRFSGNAAFRDAIAGGDGAAIETPAGSGTGYSGGGSDKKGGKGGNKTNKETEAEKALKKDLEAVKAERDNALAQNRSDQQMQLKEYDQFLADKSAIEKKYYEDAMAVYKKHNATQSDDYAALALKKAEFDEQEKQKQLARSRELVENIRGVALRMKEAEFNAAGDDSFPAKLTHEEEIFEIRMKNAVIIRDLYQKGTEEYNKAQQDIDALNFDYKEKQGKQLMDKLNEYRKQAEKKTAAEILAEEIAALEELRKRGVVDDAEFGKLRQGLVEKSDLPGAAPKKADTPADIFAKQKAELDKARAADSISEEEYQNRLQKIQDDYGHKRLEGLTSLNDSWAGQLAKMYDSWAKFGEKLRDGDNPLGALGDAVQATSAVINAAMQQAVQYTEAASQAQINAVTKRYDREKVLAEGNSFMTKKLEQKKQREIAKIKDEQNRKQFAMNIISALAQTAMNAITAYNAGLSVGGPAGLVLAPIAAAMAVAAGMVQIATMRKQQQAAQSSGYMEGGFTPRGPRDRAVGVVHAGEWVAPQQLVNNPATRPIIDMLESARSSNTIGSISQSAASRIAAPAAFRPAEEQVTVVREQQPVVVSDPNAAKVADALDRLSSKLDEPITAIATMSGDHGVAKKYDEYNQLIKNKSR